MSSSLTTCTLCALANSMSATHDALHEARISLSQIPKTLTWVHVLLAAVENQEENNNLNQAQTALAATEASLMQTYENTLDLIGTLRDVQAALETQNHNSRVGERL